MPITEALQKDLSNITEGITQSFCYLPIKYFNAQTAPLSDLEVNDVISLKEVPLFTRSALHLPLFSDFWRVTHIRRHTEPWYEWYGRMFYRRRVDIDLVSLGKPPNVFHPCRILVGNDPKPVKVDIIGIMTGDIHDCL